MAVITTKVFKSSKESNFEQKLVQEKRIIKPDCSYLGAGCNERIITYKSNGSISTLDHDYSFMDIDPSPYNIGVIIKEIYNYSISNSNKVIVTEVIKRKYPYKYRTISTRSISLNMDLAEDIKMRDLFLNSNSDFYHLEKYNYSRSFNEYDYYGISKLSHIFMSQKEKSAKYWMIDVDNKLFNYYNDESFRMASHDISVDKSCFTNLNDIIIKITVSPMDMQKHSNTDDIIINNLYDTGNNSINYYYSPLLNRIYKEDYDNLSLFNYYDIGNKDVYDIIYRNIKKDSWNINTAKPKIINMYDKNNLVLAVMYDHGFFRACFNKYHYNNAYDNIKYIAINDNNFFKKDSYNVIIDNINVFKNFDKFKENITNGKGNIIDYCQYSYESSYEAYCSPDPMNDLNFHLYFQKNK